MFTMTDIHFFPTNYLTMGYAFLRKYSGQTECLIAIESLIHIKKIKLNIFYFNSEILKFNYLFLILHPIYNK